MHPGVWVNNTGMGRFYTGKFNFADEGENPELPGSDWD
jgi:hypothetical protein